MRHLSSPVQAGLSTSGRVNAGAQLQSDVYVTRVECETAGEEQKERERERGSKQPAGYQPGQCRTEAGHALFASDVAGVFVWLARDGAADTAGQVRDEVERQTGKGRRLKEYYTAAQVSVLSMSLAMRYTLCRQVKLALSCQQHVCATRWVCQCV